MTDVAGTRHFIDVIALVISRDRRDNERGFPRMPYIFIHQARTIDKTSYTSRPTGACGFSPWEAAKHLSTYALGISMHSMAMQCTHTCSNVQSNYLI